MEKFTPRQLKLAIRGGEEDGKNIHARRFFNMLIGGAKQTREYGDFEVEIMERVLCGSWVEGRDENKKKTQDSIVQYISELYYMYKYRLDGLSEETLPEEFKKQMALIIGRYFIPGWDKHVYMKYRNQNVFFPQIDESPIAGGQFTITNPCTQVNKQYFVRNNANGDCAFETMAYFLLAKQFPTNGYFVEQSMEKDNVKNIREYVADIYLEMICGEDDRYGDKRHVFSNTKFETPQSCWAGAHTSEDPEESFKDYMRHMFGTNTSRMDLGFGGITDDQLGDIEDMWKAKVLYQPHQAEVSRLFHIEPNDITQGILFTVRFIQATRLGKCYNSYTEAWTGENFYGSIYDLRLLAYENNFQMYIANSTLSSKNKEVGEWGEITTCTFYPDTIGGPTPPYTIRVLYDASLHFDACNFGYDNKQYILKLHSTSAWSKLHHNPN